MSETQPPIKVHHHNDYLISFYAGRDQTARHLKERNWVDDSALKLGAAMYAINSGKEAIVYDIIEPENLAEHVRQLREMKGWDVAKILPNHGDPDIIKKGDAIRR